MVIVRMISSLLCLDSLIYTCNTSVETMFLQYTVELDRCKHKFYNNRFFLAFPASRIPFRFQAFQTILIWENLNANLIAIYCFSDYSSFLVPLSYVSVSNSASPSKPFWLSPFADLLGTKSMKTKSFSICKWHFIIFVFFCLYFV